MKHYYQILLGLQEEIMYLEELLFPSTTLVDPGNCYIRWILIFSILCDHPIVFALTKCIVENNLTTDEFAKESAKVLLILQGTNLRNQLKVYCCLLYTSPSPRDRTRSRMPSSA